jgi:hypothetical protein
VIHDLVHKLSVEPATVQRLRRATASLPRRHVRLTCAIPQIPESLSTMPLPRRAFLAAALAAALAGCGAPGVTQAALDARLIVTAITPLAQSARSLGAAPATLGLIDQSLATARGESAALALQYAPGLLDIQAFYLSARSLLLALSGVPGQPPAALTQIAAAQALLPTFTAILNVEDTGPPPKMSAEQARLVLRGTEVAAPASPPAPAPPAAPTPPISVHTQPPAIAAAGAAPAGRFHISADEINGRISYEFADHGQVLEQGVVANLGLLDGRYAAFKRQRLRDAP